jgi:drug/metabolite transporter (DMT)-like permease
LQLGLFNSALPFLLFAYAASNLSASLLAILNATTPMWGAAIAVATGKAALSPRLVLGQALGILGLLILLSNDATATAPGGTWAVIAALAAAFSYGIASHYAVSAPRVDPFSNSLGSLWAAALILLPAFALYPVESVPSVEVSLSVLALGVVCSGLALLLYFKLIADEGAASALSVGFLIPVFGVFWGYALLNESVGWHTLIGALVVLTGTMLVTGFSPRALKRRTDG